MRAVPTQALALVKASEGFRATRNPDPSGNNQIGYGHKMLPGDSLWNAVLSEEGAESLAMEDLETAAKEITAILGDPLIENLTDGQWSALLDFVFNEGAGQFRTSTLCSKIRAGLLSSAGAEFDRWVYAADPKTGAEVKLPGLVNRRAAETALWRG